MRECVQTIHNIIRKERINIFSDFCSLIEPFRTCFMDEIIFCLLGNLAFHTLVNQDQVKSNETIPDVYVISTDLSTNSCAFVRAQTHRNFPEG